MADTLKEAIEWLTKIVALGFPITSPKHLPIILETLNRTIENPPNDGDGVHSDALCCGGGCHV